MASPRQKGADEIFCRSCGDAIKKEAEICPNCGVRNRRRQAGTRGSTQSTTTHDPSQFSTTVSENWWYGVAGAGALWLLVLLLSGVVGDGGGALMGLLLLLAWAGMPISAYFDAQYVRANGAWNPNTALWVILLSIWLVNLVGGAVYLYRRHEVLGEP